MALTNQHIQQPGWTNLSEGRPRITSRPCSRHTTRRAVNVTYRLSNTNIARSNSLTVVGSAAAGALPMPSDKGRNYANAKPAAFPWSLLSSPYDKDIRSVALPALLGGMLEPFINAFNAAMVGQLGTQQLSAVSLASTALSSCTLLFSFLLFLTVPEVAAAAAKKDSDQVARVAGQTLWVAGVTGALLAGAMHFGAEGIVGALRPPEPAVAAEAVAYLKVRSLSVPATLLSFVATGVFRGFKDTRTPLAGTAASVAVSLGLHLLLLNVLHWGVTGAAVAGGAAALVGCSVQWGVLLLSGRVQGSHLLRPPPVAAVVPLLQRGAALSFKNFIGFGLILFASALCVRKGAAFQASFEVIRQLFFICMPFFECLNVATQSLCATALGRQDVPTARGTLSRLVGLGVCAGALAGAAIWGARGQLVAAFTSDPHVVAHVMAVLPLICAFFPIDAAASIMDGSLLAAKQTNYLSAVQVCASVLQYGLLTYLVSTNNITTLSVWAVIKLMNVARVLGSTSRTLLSPHSAYRLHNPQHHQQQHSTAAAAAGGGAAGAAAAGGGAAGAAATSTTTTSNHTSSSSYTSTGEHNGNGNSSSNGNGCGAEHGNGVGHHAAHDQVVASSSRATSSSSSSSSSASCSCNGGLKAAQDGSEPQEQGQGQGRGQGVEGGEGEALGGGTPVAGLAQGIARAE